MVLKVQFTKKTVIWDENTQQCTLKLLKISTCGAWIPLNPALAKVKYDRYVAGYYMREMSLLLVDCKYNI